MTQEYFVILILSKKVYVMTMVCNFAKYCNICPWFVTIPCTVVWLIQCHLLVNKFVNASTSFPPLPCFGAACCINRCPFVVSVLTRRGFALSIINAHFECVLLIALAHPVVSCSVPSLSSTCGVLVAQLPWLLSPAHAQQGWIPGGLHGIPGCALRRTGHGSTARFLPTVLRSRPHTYRIRQKQNGCRGRFTCLCLLVSLFASYPFLALH